MKKTGVYRFIGEDGSLGYRTNRIYELEFVDPRGYGKLAVQRRLSLLWLAIPGGIFIGMKMANRGFCPYSTTQAFRDNWEVV